MPGQFNVSATGAATYTIPIAVPPGTAGMVPALSLDYSSQSGDGIVGLGWTLSGLPSITRCPRTLAQENIHGGVNYDANDRFCMDGQRLVSINGTYGADGTEYRTEIEGFTKVISYGTAGSGPSYFRVWTKAGQIMEFGNTTDSKILAVGTSTARAWAVNKISDTKGNYLTVTYNCAPIVSSACTDTDRTTNGESYPLRIDYTGNAGASLNPYNSVQFAYTSRVDATPIYQAGSFQQTTVLLTDVKTYQSTNLVYDYHLNYRAGTSTTHSRVTSVSICDSSGTNCLAPTTFGWQGGSGTFTPTAVTPNPALISSYTSDMMFGDFNGDGLLDFIPWFSSSTYCGVLFGTQSGSFTDSGMASWFWTYEYVDTTPPTWRHVRDDLCSAQQEVSPIVLDLNGDGFSDLMLTARDSSGNPIHKFQINDEAGSLVEQGTTFPNNTTFQFGDFNGDGRGDLLISGTSSYVYYSSGDGTFAASSAISGLAGLYATRIPADFDGDGCTDVLVQGSGYTPIIKYFCNPAVSQASVPNWIANGYTIVLGDFNGDGKTDVLAINSSGATLYLSTGTGFATGIAISGSSTWSKYTITAGDFNGDGKADLVFIADGVGTHYGITTPHQIWLSTGSGFVQAATIPNSGNSADNPQFGQASINARIGDWNNDGANELWIQKPSGDLEYTFSYAPELITSINNGITATTTITYDRLNKNGTLYTKCPNNPSTYACGDTYPTVGIDGPLYVVSEVDASNGLGACSPPNTTNCYSSTYAYGGAKSDLHGRGFLGFASMAVTDVQTGVVQTTNYHTDFPFVGLIASQTKTAPKTGGGTVTLNSTTNTFADISLGTGTDGVARHFVSLSQSAVASTDQDSSTGNTYAMPTTTTNYTYDCSTGMFTSICAGTSPTGFGNATEIDVSTTYGGSTTSTKDTTNTFLNDSTNWFLGRLTSTVVASTVGSSSITRTSCFQYDSGTGLLTREVIEPISTSNCTYSSIGVQTDYTYDPYGHRVTVTVSGSAITSRSTSAGYDSLGEFQTSATNALSQSETWAYDVRFGAPTSHTGPNGLTTTWSYDTFGRKTLETRPDGNKTVVSYAYCSGVNGGSASCVTNGAYIATATPQNSGGTQNGPQSITYYDSLSRSLASDVQGFDGSWIRSAIQYDTNGRVSQTSRPYFVSGGTPKWTVNTYDPIGRVTHVALPNGGTVDFVFQGLTTTATNDHGQTTTTVKNPQGLVASVTDPLSHTTSYVYDAEGDLLTVTDPSNNVITNTYDLRGNKTASSDPDMGSWSYVYDVLGELSSQTDAKSQTTTLTYDLLGRVTSRTEADLYSVWTFDTASHGIGKLAEARACTSSGCSTVVSDRTFTYDSLGRPSTSTLAAGGTNYTYTDAYDSNGRLSTVAYPSGFTALYAYTSLGYLSQIKDNATGATLWTANSRDAEMHPTGQTFGNGVSQTNSYDPATGFLAAESAGSGTVARFDYTFDTLGNLTYRKDYYASGTPEYSCYDALNRLTNYAVGNGASTCTSSGSGINTKTVAYDALGNITSKSDVGAYSYPSGGSARPHAVSAIAGTVNGVVNPNYHYDANGNMDCTYTGSYPANCSGAGAVRAVSYTSFN
ncbi:MAG: VCBS repeat-containing protein, partial [Alphaproteobacteria bacterium]|nr:VCBS repeat-containing protein [Alphaproteobacteria bacterium]